MKSAFKRTKNKEKEKIAIETTDWFLKIKSGPLSPEEEFEFYAWLLENPQHKQKFDMANALWHVSEEVADDLREIAEMDDIQDEPRTSPMKRWLGRINMRSPVLQFSAMFTVVLVIVLGLWMSRPDVPSKVTYQSNTGELKKVFLPDGSIVILDTESAFSRYYTDESRNIDLIKGRAFFSVAKDPTHPFIVRTGRVVARALGTEFNVYRDENDTISVTVTRGRVQVSQKENGLPTGGESTFIDEKPLQGADVILAGQEILIDEREQKKEIRPVEIQHANTWQEGRLYFQNTPLRVVIDEINRYLLHKIIIRDYSAGDLIVSLNYDIRRHDKFLDTLEKVLPVDYEIAPDGKIYLYKKG